MLGRLCYADLLRAEEVTPPLWRTGQLRHVLPSGEVVHITPAQRADIMPADPYAAEASAVKETVLVLTESMHLLSLTRQECVDSAIAVELPETFRSPPARRAKQRASNTLLYSSRSSLRIENMKFTG